MSERKEKKGGENQPHFIMTASGEAFRGDIEIFNLVVNFLRMREVLAIEGEKEKRKRKKNILLQSNKEKKKEIEQAAEVRGQTGLWKGVCFGVRRRIGEGLREKEEIVR